MKSLIIISSILAFTINKGFSQDLITIDEVKSFILDLPITSDNASIIKVAKERFKNNRIDSFVIQSNTKIYFEDTSISYNYFNKTPVLTTLKIFDLWSFDNPQSKDTILYVTIDASFGTDKKAERNMFRQYRELKSKFEDRFVTQKPYSLYGEGKIAEGLNFLFSENENHPVFNIGWSNGGCFPDYHVSVSFLRKK
jgi:hypothetical protein